MSTRCRSLVHAVVARNATRFCEDRWWRFESSRRYPCVFTSRSGDQIGLQIRSRWVQFLGGVRIVRASARAAVWRDSRWISSGLSTRHFLRARSRATRTPRGVAQIGRALGSGPRGRWFKSTYPDARIGSSTGRALAQASHLHNSSGNGPPADGYRLSLEGCWFESNPMRASASIAHLGAPILCHSRPATGRRWRVIVRLEVDAPVRQVAQWQSIRRRKPAVFNSRPNRAGERRLPLVERSLVRSQPCRPSFFA